MLNNSICADTATDNAQQEPVTSSHSETAASKAHAHEWEARMKLLNPQWQPAHSSLGEFD